MNKINGPLLFAIQEFLILSDFDLDDTRPFQQLQLALADLDDGIVPPLLVPTRAPQSRPREPRERRLLWAYAAATMESLMSDLQYSKGDAARFVAKELLRLGIETGNSRRGKVAQTVASWRDRAKAGDKTFELDAEVYDDFFASFRPVLKSVNTKDERARNAAKGLLLEALEAACRRLGLSGTPK